MQVGILGPLVVLAEGRMAQIGGSRLRVLLVRLSLDPGHLVTIDALASALWPEGGPADPANAIQTLVSRLRRALPRSQILRSAPGGYWLDVPPDAVDAVRFERLVREGRRALRGGEPALAAPAPADREDGFRLRAAPTARQPLALARQPAGVSTHPRSRTTAGIAARI